MSIIKAAGRTFEEILHLKHLQGLPEFNLMGVSPVPLVQQCRVTISANRLWGSRDNFI